MTRPVGASLSNSILTLACGPTEVCVLLTVFGNEEKGGREVAERVQLL
jgi:hypothetical protein